MKKSIKSVFLAFMFLTTLLSGCAPASTPIPPTLTPIPPTGTPVPAATNTPQPTPTPTPIPGELIFSETFDDNSQEWDLGDGLATIKNGAMQLTNGAHQLGAIIVPINSALKNSRIQIDISPSPNNDPPLGFFYGAGCRMNSENNDFYLYGVTQTEAGNGLFIAIFLEFLDAKQVVSEIGAGEFPEAKNGAGYTVTFTCDGNTFTAGPAQAINDDLSEGYIFLGIYQPDGIRGSVNFDNLIVTELP